MSYTVLTGEADAALLRRAVEHAIPAACLRDDEAAIREAFSDYRRVCDARRKENRFDRIVSFLTLCSDRWYAADHDFDSWCRALRNFSGDPWDTFSWSYGEKLAAGILVAGKVQGDTRYEALDKACRDALVALEDGREVFFPADTFRRITNLLKELAK